MAASKLGDLMRVCHAILDMMGVYWLGIMRIGALVYCIS
jgi:hypothetical protein